MPLRVLRGIPVPWRVRDDSSLQGVLDLEVREDDIFVISYPKSGTVWLQKIVSCILGCGEDQTNVNLGLELSLGSGGSEEEIRAAPPVYKVVETWTSPRVMITHLLPRLLPAQLLAKKAKMLYIARNPKDVVVSYSHFTSAVKAPEPFPQWEEFVPAFLEGNMPYGSWFTHVKQYWEMRHHENFLFLKYEDLKKDEHAVIHQVGRYLGQNLDAQKIKEISDHCSIDSMRKKFSEKKQAITMFMDETKSPFVRKGKVGDWRERLTTAQSQQFDQLYEEHLGGSGLTFDY
ncbi:sulfotransferase family cytosolic 1B member 1-like [Acanthaster planci]|uniref:Sulfotransferase family cytosolic 1B member 1-like n=1 Tax=Acanthaster planci TaxID=133434 RepID=A0A8B7Z4X4_ACAPL|nr:sulfotransferase family cytosolic 1B member 1-like [Acanthaster planci]